MLELNVFSTDLKSSEDEELEIADVFVTKSTDLSSGTTEVIWRPQRPKLASDATHKHTQHPCSNE
jgi:hypothetical protein